MPKRRKRVLNISPPKEDKVLDAVPDFSVVKKNVVAKKNNDSNDVDSDSTIAESLAEKNGAIGNKPSNVIAELRKKQLVYSARHSFVSNSVTPAVVTVAAAAAAPYMPATKKKHIVVSNSVTAAVVTSAAAAPDIPAKTKQHSVAAKLVTAAVDTAAAAAPDIPAKKKKKVVYSVVSGSCTSSAPSSTNSTREYSTHYTNYDYNAAPTDLKKKQLL
jgi:hypothetical protein